jgi:hypothetical protein
MVTLTISLLLAIKTAVFGIALYFSIVSYSNAHIALGTAAQNGRAETPNRTETAAAISWALFYLLCNLP